MSHFNQHLKELNNNTSGIKWIYIEINTEIVTLFECRCKK